MPNRPTRPGKHAARHKAPPAYARAGRRLVTHLQPLGLRRTGGTVVALGAVVLAGAAGNGASGVGSDAPQPSQTAMDLPSSSTVDTTAEDRAARAAEVSRSQARAELRDHSPEAPEERRTGAHTARATSTVPEDPREIAEQMMAGYGWGSGEFECLDELWVSESDWQVGATNPTSGAYGIPQSLPPEKMASAGSDWRTNPATQIEWGLKYIDLSYGTPCSAWEFKQANNWY